MSRSWPSGKLLHSGVSPIQPRTRTTAEHKRWKWRIESHHGAAERVRKRYSELPQDKQDAVLAFLGSLKAPDSGVKLSIVATEPLPGDSDGSLHCARVLVAGRCGLRSC